MAKTDFELIVDNAKQYDLYAKISSELEKNKLNSFFKEDKQLSFILAIASIESRCDPTKINEKTEVKGLTQVSKSAMADVGMGDVNAMDTSKNIELCIKIINNTIKRYLQNEKGWPFKGYTIWDFLKNDTEKLAWILIGFNQGIGYIKKYFKDNINSTKTELKQVGLQKAGIYYDEFQKFYDFWSDPTNIDAIKKVEKKPVTEKKEIKNIYSTGNNDNRKLFLTQKGHVISETLLRKLITRHLI